MTISEGAISASGETMTLPGVASSPVCASAPSLSSTLAPVHLGTLALWHSGTSVAGVQLPPEGGSHKRRVRSGCLGRQSGFTFIELLVVTTILLILASAVM